MTDALPDKIRKQIEKAKLPTGGGFPFEPKLRKRSDGSAEIEKGTISLGPKAGKRDYVDSSGRIWIKDRAHAGHPDHWDVQIDGGDDYVKVDFDGNQLS